MSKSEIEILEVLNGLGSKKLDLDILFSYYSLLSVCPPMPVHSGCTWLCSEATLCFNS